MGGDTEEHIFQVLERGHVDQFAALDEGIEQRGSVRALEAPREQPVLPAHGHDPELVLGAVVIDGQPAVVNETLQGGPRCRHAF